MKVFSKGVLFVVLLSSSFICLAQNIDSSISSNFNEDTNKTTVLLKGISLPQNKDKFAVGAFFEFAGDKIQKSPCCVGIFFTSISKKKFKFKENHNLTIWADKEKFSFNDAHWQESAEATAFVIAQIAFPEEIFATMKSDIFQKIANAKSVKMQLGDFKFSLKRKHLIGFKNLVDKMNLNK